LFREEQSKNGFSDSNITDRWKALTHTNRKIYLDAAMAECNQKRNEQMEIEQMKNKDSGHAESSSPSSLSSSSSSSSSTTTTTTKISSSSSSSSSSTSKLTNKRGNIAIDAPILREIRRFDNVQELVSIFGPASMVRVVSSMLTPSGRVKVKHYVKNPVLLKFDGRTNELSVGFSVAVEFVRSNHRSNSSFSRLQNR
jgi:hypothetical protein